MFALSSLEAAYLPLHTACAGLTVFWCHRLQRRSWSYYGCLVDLMAPTNDHLPSPVSVSLQVW